MSGSGPAPSREEKAHLLVVEDEPTIRHIFSILLTSAGYSVAEAENGFAALEQIRQRSPVLILSDLNMPGMTGFELLSVVRRRFPQMHVIAMSGAFTGDEVPAGVAADAFYEKSGRNIATLVDVIEGILTRQSAPDRTPPDPSRIALWVTRLGAEIHGPYILLACPECLRSFPHATNEEVSMKLQQTTCIFCAAPISYALLDPAVAHHPGYAPESGTPGR